MRTRSKLGIGLQAALCFACGDTAVDAVDGSTSTDAQTGSSGVAQTVGTQDASSDASVDTGSGATSTPESSETTAATSASETGQETGEGPACDGVECGPGPGTCVSSDGRATCQCDPGFHSEGLWCLVDACEGEGCPMTVAEWEELFADEYADQADFENCEQLVDGYADQGLYFASYCVDGLVSLWRATGDNAYLDEVLRLVFRSLEHTVEVNGYRQWPGPDNGSTYPLWDSYYWRHVITLVRVMYEHPELRAMNDYEAQYQELLAFSEHDLWERRQLEGEGNFYRSRTHMASHWARIGMELHAITGAAEYLEVFENISFDGLPGDGSSLLGQMEANPAMPSAWVWSSVWGEPPNSTVQDTSHGGAIVAFITEAAQTGDYGWQQPDVTALTSTLMDVVWDPLLDGAYAQNVDGTGGTYGAVGELGGRAHEWMHLGSFSPEVQQRMESTYIDPTRRNMLYFGFQAAGIGAYNARMLAYGSPAY